MIDIVNLSIRIALLLIMGATIQTAFAKRLWVVAGFAFSIWLIVFRLSLLRSIAIYAGVFKYQEPSFLENFKQFLVSGWFNNLCDFLLLVGSLALYVYVACYHFKFKGEVRKDDK
jgi:hypothetical protein